MIGSLYNLLCRHTAGAVDDVLLEAVRIGELDEQAAAVEALLHRRTMHGLAGLVGLFTDLPEPLQRRLVEASDVLAPAASRCARADQESVRIGAARFVAMAGDPKLLYVLSELLRGGGRGVFDAACGAAASLAGWVAATTADLRHQRLVGAEAEAAWGRLVALRKPLEQLVARGLDTPRGAESPALAQAAVALLEERTGPLYDAFKRHGGKAWPLVLARLERPMDADTVGALLACGSRGNLRQELPELIGAMERPELLEGLLSRRHWLADPSVMAVVSQVMRGTWWSLQGLKHDLEGRAARLPTAIPEATAQADPAAVVAIGDWLSHSGVGGSFLDDLFDVLLADLPHDADARLSLLLAARGRIEGGSIRLLCRFLDDPDERVARMAARALSRHASGSAEKALIRRASTAPHSVREVISRGIGDRSFSSLWHRYEQMPYPTRIAAGRALLKILPDTLARLRRRIVVGPVSERIKGLNVATELDLVLPLQEAVLSACAHSDAKVRSKATLMLGKILQVTRNDAAEQQLEAALNDSDPRVRANAIEVLEHTGRRELRSLLEARSRLGRNRERANAIKAMATLRLSDPHRPLFDMLRDSRDPHRRSAVWAVEQTGQWKLLDEVVRLARTDPNLSIRRSALGTVRRVAEQMRRPTAPAVHEAPQRTAA